MPISHYFGKRGEMYSNEFLDQCEPNELMNLWMPLQFEPINHRQFF